VRDLPVSSLLLLHQGDKTVRWQEFLLSYRARKSLTVSRCAYEERKGERYITWTKQGPKVLKTVVLWDVFGFFQKKFVSVLQEWFAGTPLEHKYAGTIDDIIQGKQRRGSFTIEEMRTMVLPYCLAECAALEDLMHLLSQRIKDAQLVLSRWDGAGAVSSAAMTKYGIKSHIKTKEGEDYTPVHITYAAEHAFFGGWIEAFKFGSIRHPLHRYDICSAYPDALRRLPSLRGGEWVPCNRPSMGSLWIAHISWSCPEHYLFGPCPFSWRGPGGLVRRLLQGQGWQWGYEIEACLDSMPDIQVCIDRAYEFVPATDDKPFAYIEDFYEQRRAYKQAGNGAEKVLKLAMNGCWGKTAQSLGYNKERGKKPPFHSMVYAGAAISWARAKLTRAVAQKRDAIIAVATDGIYSLQELDLDIGSDLGQWEHELLQSMTLVQPGFYWFTNLKGEEKKYYRGFNEGCVSRQQIDDLYAKEEAWKISLPTKRFVTLGAAVGLHNFSLMGTWREKSRELDLYHQSSSKRVWLGERETFDDNIRLTRARQFDFSEHPELRESRKYEFEWDSEFDGQRVREFVEDMFHQELSPED
jgi:hypothetical protein